MTKSYPLPGLIFFQGFEKHRANILVNIHITEYDMHLLPYPQVHLSAPEAEGTRHTNMHKIIAGRPDFSESIH